VKSIIVTIVLFLGAAGIAAYAAGDDGKPHMKVKEFTIENEGFSGAPIKIIKFQDGDVTCYIPLHREALFCFKD
jgi:hypothetical protein